MRSLDRLFRVLAGQVCILLVLAAAVPVGAATDLILMPTARTIGDGRYNVAIEREAELGNAGETEWALNAKVGLGSRAEVGLNADLSGESDSSLLWRAKYVIPVDRESVTDLGIGFRSLGNGSKWSPYTVLTHRLGEIYVHLGVREAESAAVVFAGIDGEISDRLEWMADYDNGGSSIASVGAEYEFAEGWSVRAGVRFPREGDSEKVNLELKYSGRFR